MLSRVARNLVQDTRRLLPGISCSPGIGYLVYPEITQKSERSLPGYFSSISCSTGNLE